MADSENTTTGPRHSWFKFFPSDWKGDELLAMCSLGARGLLMEFLCLMHRATPYGYLVVNGKAPSDSELARLVRASNVGELKRLKAELLDRGVLSEDGQTLFSRRMVRKGKQSAIGRATGALGGNPALTGSCDTPLTPTLNGPPTQHEQESLNTQKLEARNQIPKKKGDGMGDDDRIRSIAYQLREVYPEIYAAARAGAVYRTTIKTEERDNPNYYAAAELHPDIDRLRALLEVFLTAPFGEKSSPGTPGQFVHMLPECDERLRRGGWKGKASA